MDKKNEIKELALFIDKMFYDAEDCPDWKECELNGGEVNIQCFPCKLAHALVSAGYGNITQALTKFAEITKKNIHVNVYNDDFANKVIDDTLSMVLKEEV